MNHQKPSIFAPFRHTVFTVLWIATLISNVGTWMFNVTAGWLITELSPSPLMVSLVQAATALPILLFALPAGAIGDLFDRRKLLLLTQIVLAILLFVFVGILWAGVHSAWLLLFFTFLVGVGTAFSSPPFQAIVPKLVPKEHLHAAVTLNGVSINIARALGPAVGGFLLVATGAAITVFLDAASYLVVVAALLWWKTGSKAADSLPRERMAGAMMAGMRFSLRSESLRHTLVRVLAFFPFASAYWALLPLVAKELLHGGPTLYSALLTALGVGAVSGVFILSPLKERLHANYMVALGTALTALAMVMFAYGGNSIVGVLAGGIAGLSWIMVVSALNVSAQFSLPDWVRARGLAIFQMVLFGSMTAGSVIWGQVAVHYGVAVALAASSILALIGIALTWRFKLNLDEHQNHLPSGHWPEPVLLTSVSHDYGPVLVTLEYQIRAEDRNTFDTLIRKMGANRCRDGAVQWGYFEDVERPGMFIEIFTTESWLDHLRQHARVSHADKVLQDAINALHQGDAPPRVIHAVTPRRGEAALSFPHEHPEGK